MQMSDDGNDKRPIKGKGKEEAADAKIASSSNKKRPPAQLKLDDSEDTQPGSIIAQPRPHDVLFGRGRPLQAHPGNLRFHKIVNQHREDYKTARKDDKVRIQSKYIH